MAENNNQKPFDLDKPEQTVSFFQKYREDHPEVESIKNQLDPIKHDVFDNIKRPKKKVKADAGETVTETKEITNNGVTEKVALKEQEVVRIGIGYQKLIVNRAVAFAFGNAPDYKVDIEENTPGQEVFEALKKILIANKDFALNRELASELFSFTEVAELWYPVEVENHTMYGIETKFKLKCMLLKPSNGEKFYPYFDEYGDMTAFCREYKRVDDKNEDIEYFEVYTKEKITKYQNTGGWVISPEFPKTNIINKIPVIYSKQDQTEWELVQNIINRDETLRSNFGDTNDYHSDPKIFVKGDVKGWAEKGQAGQIIQGEENSSASYLAWNNAPESVRQEHAMNREDIYTLTQTPDTSFYNMKTLGAMSGRALELLFFDAILKVKQKEGMLVSHLQRRVNVILAFLAMMSTKHKEECKNMQITPEIKPYLPGDEGEKNANLLTAVNGGFMSKKTAIKRAGYVKDAEAELEQMQEEFTKENTLLMGEPTDV